MPNPEALNQSLERSPQEQQSQNNPLNQKTESSSNSTLLNSKNCEKAKLRYGASHAIKLFIPVSICMAFVILSTVNLKFYTETNQYLFYTPFAGDKSDLVTQIWNSLANALVFMFFVVCMTFVLIFLYLNRYYKVIYCWLLISSSFLLFLFVFIYFSVILQKFNIPMDHITVALIIWNFGIIGMLSIHWKGPLIIQQTYLLIVSALMALILIKYIPEWTVWSVLSVISLWDLFAVLTPRGPLRILVETAQSRNEPIFPALIYSSAVAYYSLGTMADDSHNNQQLVAGEEPIESQQQVSKVPKVQSLQKIEKTLESQPCINNEQGIKLGLGDFIFYSVLVGKASSYGDWNTTLACFVTILYGLCLTLLLLAFFKKALPALPISIFLGLIAYFTTSIITGPFIANLIGQQIYI